MGGGSEPPTSTRSESPTTGGAAQATSDGLDAPLREEAEQAVTQLGWKPAIARAAVSSAIAASAPATLERLICEALRRCLSLQRGL